jgi:hypothetical protein
MIKQQQQQKPGGRPSRLRTLVVWYLVLMGILSAQEQVVVIDSSEVVSGEWHRCSGVRRCSDGVAIVGGLS